MAGAMAAVKVDPVELSTEASVLRAPIRFEMAPAPGSLGDWRTVLGLPHHSGAVEYETVLQTQAMTDAVLDLGHVRGTAEAWLDGEALGVRLWRPYRFALGAALAEGPHLLRIRVTNTLGAHYEVGRPTAMVASAMDDYGANTADGAAARMSFAAGGLFGPVQIVGASV